MSNFTSSTSGIGLSPSNADLIEKILISLFLGALALRLIPGALSNGNLLPIVLVVSDALVVAFILLRRPTERISLDWRDWLFGMAGTTIPLLAAVPGSDPILPVALCGVIMIAGIGLNLAAKLTLRRSFGIVAANRGVKVGGPYRWVRHPMYAGYIITQLGFLMSGPSFWNLSIYVIAFAMQVARMNAEERILSEDPEYRAMADRVRYRILPFIY